MVKRALNEHYDMSIDFDRLNFKQTQKMLGNVKTLLADARKDRKVYESHKNGAFLKLVMMEQALSDRLEELRYSRARIVVENEEVQKSQVILAAQDMIDNLQKMLEQVSKMNVEELNAVVQGMSNEFGSEVAEQFNASANEALTALQQAVTAAKTSLTSSLGAVTGEGPAAPALPGAAPGAELGAEAGMAAEVPAPEPEMVEPGAEEVPEPEAEPDVSGAGRERR